MTPTLAIAMEQRGDQSWGVTDGEFIHKQKGSITDTFVDCDLDGPVYHTRMASVGAVSDRNAHPFHFEAKNIVTGVHNGHISNYFALKNKYNRNDAEVDSEHIFMNIAEGKPVADLAGNGAVVWYEQPADKSMARRRFFSRFNTEALHFAKMKSGEIVFASTADSIRIAAQLASAKIDFFYKTEEKVRYWLEEKGKGDFALYHDLKLPWAEDPVTYTYTGGSSSGTRSSFGGVRTIAADDCPSRSGCNGKVTEDELICKWCMDELRKDIFGDQTVAGA